jgi:hypothetical protein
VASLDRELFDFLASQTGLVPGVEVFRGPYPPEGPDEACALIWRGGTGENPTQLARPRVQVLCRGRTQDTALALYQKVRAVLAANYAVELPSQELYASQEESAGFIGQDAKHRYEFSANYVLATDRLL